MIEESADRVDVIIIDDNQAIEILDLLSSVPVEQLQKIRNYLIIQIFFDDLAKNKQVMRN